MQVHADLVAGKVDIKGRVSFPKRHTLQHSLVGSQNGLWYADVAQAHAVLLIFTLAAVHPLEMPAMLQTAFQVCLPCHYPSAIISVAIRRLSWNLLFANQFVYQAPKASELKNS